MLLSYSRSSETGKKCWEHRRRKLCHQPKSRSLVLLCTFPQPLVNWQPLHVRCSLCQGLQPTWRALKPISDNIDGIIPTLFGLLLQDKQRRQPHHVFFSQHHSPLRCRVSSKCLFSLERSLLEADTVKLEPFQRKCVQLGKMIHPQEQRLAFLCNHNKIKVPCQFPLSFLNDCTVCRSAGLYQHLRAAHNSLPCFWLGPAAQICKCLKNQLLLMHTQAQAETLQDMQNLCASIFVGAEPLSFKVFLPNTKYW